MTYLRDPGVIQITMEIRETDPRFSVGAGGLFSNMADFCGRSHLEFSIRLLLGDFSRRHLGFGEQ